MCGVCVCACVCVRVRVCVCVRVRAHVHVRAWVLGRKRSWVFASTALILIEVSMAIYLTTYNDYLTFFCEPLSAPYI